MSLVHEFCKEYLNGDLSKLRWFSFDQLARIPRTDYKCPRRLGAAETRGAFVIRGAPH